MTVVADLVSSRGGPARSVPIHSLLGSGEVGIEASGDNGTDRDSRASTYRRLARCPLRVRARVRDAARLGSAPPQGGAQAGAGRPAYPSSAAARRDRVTGKGTGDARRDRPRDASVDRGVQLGGPRPRSDPTAPRSDRAVGSRPPLRRRDRAVRSGLRLGAARPGNDRKGYRYRGALPHPWYLPPGGFRASDPRSSYRRSRIRNTEPTGEVHLDPIFVVNSRSAESLLSRSLIRSRGRGSHPLTIPTIDGRQSRDLERSTGSRYVLLYGLIVGSGYNSRGRTIRSPLRRIYFLTYVCCYWVTYVGVCLYRVMPSESAISRRLCWQLA